MDGARHAVVQLGVQLGQDVLLVHGCLGDVPDSGRLDDVADDELLNRLVLRNATSAVGATDGLHVPTVVLAPSSITPLLGLQERKQRGSISNLNVNVRLCFLIEATWKGIWKAKICHFS